MGRFRLPGREARFQPEPAAEVRDPGEKRPFRQGPVRTAQGKEQPVVEGAKNQAVSAGIVPINRRVTEHGILGLHPVSRQKIMTSGRKPRPGRPSGNRAIIIAAGPGHPALATAGGFGAVLLWSVTIAVVRSLGERLGPVSAAAAVYSVSGVLSLAVLAVSRDRRGRLRDLPRRYLLCCGALFTGYTLLLFLAVGLADSRRQVMEIGLLNYLWPVLTLLILVAVFRRRARLLLLPGTVLALAGIYLVIFGKTGAGLMPFGRNLAANPVAYGLGLAAAFSWAFYSNFTRAWAGGRKNGAVDLFLPVTAVFFLAVSLFVGEPRAWHARSVAEALCLGASTFLAYRMWDGAMRRGNMAAVAAFSYLAPLFSSAVNVFYLGVKPGAVFWAGCVLLVAGSGLSWYSVSGVPDPAGRPGNLQPG